MCNIERVTIGTRFVPPSTPARSHYSFSRAHTHACWYSTHTGRPIGEPSLGQVFISRSHPRPQDLLPLGNVPRSATDFQNSYWKVYNSREFPRTTRIQRRAPPGNGRIREMTNADDWTSSPNASKCKSTYCFFFIFAYVNGNSCFRAHPSASWTFLSNYKNWKCEKRVRTARRIQKEFFWIPELWYEFFFHPSSENVLKKSSLLCHQFRALSRIQKEFFLHSSMEFFLKGFLFSSFRTDYANT